MFPNVFSIYLKYTVCASQVQNKVCCIPLVQFLFFFVNDNVLIETILILVWEYFVCDVDVNFSFVFTKFNATAVLSSYLVALFVSNFETIRDNSSSKPSINVHTRPNQAEYTGVALEYSRRLVDVLGSWTAMKYEDLGIDKMDFVAVPYFPFGAVENWGLVTMQ